jgi:predicted transcriptional regulator
MPITHQRITIVKIRRPNTKDLNQDLKWFAHSLGLFNLRDKDKSCFRIFIEILKSAKRQDYLTSDELADKLGLSRGTVIHHIHKLVDAGIVIPQRNTYLLRVDNLKALVDELRKDLRRTMDDLEQVAEQIDSWLGL